jgi:O-antigen/teichoic acid export membrane protein
MGQTSSRYSAGHIRQSARIYLLGKLVSAVGGIIAVILLARYLSIAEFAVYSALTGFVEMFTALAGFGITHALLRFLPELFAKHQDHSMKRLIGIGILTRTFTLTIAVILVSFGSEPVTGFFKLSEWQDTFNLFLLLVWVRVTFHFLFQILETLLAQAVGQSGFVLTNILKLAGIVTAIVWEQLDLLLVIRIEIAAEIIGAGVLALGLIRRIKAHCNHDELKSGWLASNWQRVWRFGLIGYLQHLAVLLYGGSPNRLAGARYLASGDMASLGFAQSLVDTMRRYLPAQLFQGIIYPVIIARYATGRNFADIARITDLLLRFNTVVLGIPLVILLVSGEDLLSFLSNDKYSEQACLGLILFSVALAFESDRFLLDILVQAVERFDMLLYTNLLLSASLFLALFLFPTMGVAAIPLANIAGLVVANAIVRIWLRLKGFKCRMTWSSYVKIIFASILSVTTGRFTNEWLAQNEIIITWLYHWIISGSIAIVSYLFLILLLKPFSNEELSGLKRIKQGEG